MKREFEAFLQAPTPGSFLAAFRVLLAQSDETLSAEKLLSLLALLESGEHDALVQAIEELPPVAALSPAVHWIAAESAQARSDRGDVELELFLLATCLSAILDTGDGTEAAPYLVPCAMDEGYVCAALGKSLKRTALTQQRGRAVDIVKCGDGTTVCFDVSGEIALPAPATRRKSHARHDGNSRPANTLCTSGERKRLSRTRR